MPRALIRENTVFFYCWPLLWFTSLLHARHPEKERITLYFSLITHSRTLATSLAIIIQGLLSQTSSDRNSAGCNSCIQSPIKHKMERFPKIVNGLKPLLILANTPSSCLTLFWICFCNWRLGSLSKHLITASQWWKHQSNVWNMFKINNKATRIMSTTSFWCPYC